MRDASNVRSIVIAERSIVAVVGSETVVVLAINRKLKTRLNATNWLRKDASEKTKFVDCRYNNFIVVHVDNEEMDF